MASHVVAAVDEIPPGQRKLVEVSGRNIVVFNLGGEFFALNNRCPHRGGSLRARHPDRRSWSRRSPANTSARAPARW